MVVEVEGVISTSISVSEKPEAALPDQFHIARRW